jgi:hypothetical protein
MPTDRNPMVLFANDGVQKCYDYGIKKVAYFEKMMEANLSSPPAYRQYQKLAEAYDKILSLMRDNILHVDHKIDLKRLLLIELANLHDKIQKG